MTSSEKVEFSQLRFDFDYEKQKIAELLLLYRFLEDLTSSDSLPRDVKLYLQELLFCREANFLDQKLQSCLVKNGQILPKYQKPSNFKSTLQKALVGTLNEYESVIEKFLSGCSTSTAPNASSFINQSKQTEREIIQSQNELMNLSAKYKEDLESYMKSLQTYIDKIILCQLMKSQKITNEWLETKADGLLLKARLVELQYLNNAYKPDRICKLQQITKSQNRSANDIQQKIVESKALLEKYNSISGEKFNKFIAEYERLNKEIQNKTWALKEFS